MLDDQCNVVDDPVDATLEFGAFLICLTAVSSQDERTKLINSEQETIIQ